MTTPEMTLRDAWCKVIEWCANPPWLPDSDDQQLSIDGTVLTLEDGGTVDLAPFLDNTDDQQITDFSLTGTTLTITLEDGGTQTVDLAALTLDEVEVIEVTCAQLIALGNAGSVVVGQHYLVTDYNRGTVGAAQILTHGVTANTVSWNVAVQTTFDDSAWAARWDPDTCRIVDMFDNRGNKVRSDNGDEIERFPWGNALVTGNDFTDTGFVYSGGTVRDNEGHPTAYLQISGGSITGTRLGGSSDVRMSGGFVTNSTIDEGRLLVDGTGRFDDSHLGGSSYVDTDSIEIRDSRFDVASLIYGDGGVGRIDRMSSDRGYVDMRNAADIDFDDVDLDTYGRIFANGAQRMRLQYVNISSLAYVQATPAATALEVFNSTVEDAALIQATGGTLIVRSTSVRNIARIQHSATGSNRVDNSTLDSYGRMFFNNDADGNRANYMHIDSLAMLRFRAASKGNTADRNRLSAQGYIDFVNETDSLARYNSVDTIGYIILNGGTGVTVSYSTMSGYGRMLIRQGSTGRVLGVNVEGTAYLRLSNHASDLRYSAFDSYFYYYLTGNTAVKQGLDGSGRQTYTEPNPTVAVTGPGVRNW